MPRPTWKGSLSFGLVDIPVALHSAEERNDLSFTQLDRRDFSPVGYKRVNKASGEEVPWGEIVKGYEYEDDEYVVLGDADFKRANVDASKTLEIMDFVDAKDIDPSYFHRPYYLEPLRKDSKGYALLREALTRTGKIGIGQFVLRTRQYLCAVYPRGKVLVLDLLRYAHELRDDAKLELPPADAKRAGLKERELEMAVQLVEGMSSEWKPERYKDTWADDLHALIKKKIKAGKTHTIEEPEEDEEPQEPSNVLDLTKLLQRSLHGRKPARKAPARRTAARAKRRRKAA